MFFFFFQAEDGIRDLVRSRGLGDVYKRQVVNISTTKTYKGRTLGNPFGRSPFNDYFGDDFFNRFFGDIPQQDLKQRSLGSGFIISNDGYIFTNNHVVENTDKILVKISDGKEYEAKIIGTDAKTDIALIKIKPDNGLPTVEIGDSDAVRVGEWVIAIGNPFGLEQTVTAGIVSAKGRVIGAGAYDNFIQTDASINPGNSGGPLFNMQGKVIGINTAIVAQGQGIGFAIPINMAKNILNDLKTKGKVTRGWLGVSIQNISEDIQIVFDVNIERVEKNIAIMHNGCGGKGGNFRRQRVRQIDVIIIPIAGIGRGKIFYPDEFVTGDFEIEYLIFFVSRNNRYQRNI